jgi:hypothetical protein
LAATQLAPDWHELIRYSPQLAQVSITCRFSSIDPLAEKNLIFTPYHFCSDNPINRVDPDGRWDGWYEGSDNLMRYDPDIHSQTDIDSKYGLNAYAFRFEESTITKNGSTISYNSDGSSFFSNQGQAIEFMGKSAMTYQKEVGAFINNKGWYVMPFYLNEGGKTYLDKRYNFSYENSSTGFKFSLGDTYKNIKANGFIHTHQESFETIRNFALGKAGMLPNDKELSTGDERTAAYSYTFLPYYALAWDNKIYGGIGVLYNGNKYFKELDTENWNFDILRNNLNSLNSFSIKQTIIYKNLYK